MPMSPPERAAFQDGLPPESEGRPWWALHTRPRQEKSLTRQLCDRFLPFHLLLIERCCLWKDLRPRHRLIASGAPLTPEDRLAPGMRLEIVSGPIAAWHGRILRASGRRFVPEGFSFRRVRRPCSTTSPGPASA
jgi:hypothetical protein